jgi:hypothetical protein
MASLDKYHSSLDWDNTNAVVLTREGAVCFNAWVRGTGSGKTVSRDAFYAAILDGATTGEAHLYALNIMTAKDENKIKSYDLNANMFYGDPAVTLYKPTSPTYDPANVTANGNTLTVNAPQTYWVDYIDSTGKYVYTAPGLAGFTSESVDGTFFATYTTGLQITNMTQEGGVPSPLGWIGMREGQDYVIDEHWDNTRTIYWRVRFEQFNESTGNFTRTINQIDYTIDYVISDLPGDLDMNGYVDLADFAAFAAHWLQTDCDLGNSFCGGANINLIDDVDLDDLLILTGNWLEGVIVEPPGQASNPNPADGATNVDLNADLSWTAGSFAESHDVYFGTSSSPPFIQNQTAATFDPGTMAPSTTYYWRIDEVNSWGTTTGTVWYFTTESGPPPF